MSLSQTILDYVNWLFSNQNIQLHWYILIPSIIVFIAIEILILSVKPKNKNKFLQNFVIDIDSFKEFLGINLGLILISVFIGFALFGFFGLLMGAIGLIIKLFECLGRQVLVVIGIISIAIFVKYLLYLIYKKRNGLK